MKPIEISIFTAVLLVKTKWLNSLGAKSANKSLGLRAAAQCYDETLAAGLFRAAVTAISYI